METKEQLVQRILDYAENVKKKKIIAGNKHRQSCIRFLNDVKQIPKKKYEFYFDADEVERFYYWSKMFKHSKGVLAGQHIEIDDFQLFIVANIFGWKKKKNDRRRYRKSYIQVGRKNAKSQLLSLITSYETFLSGEEAECYVAGVDREQSGIVFNTIVSQLANAPLLKGKYKYAYGRILHKKSNSIIQPLSKEAKKTGDGKNPSFVVIDEYHAHKTSEVYDVLLSGMAARPNGHICIITTAGLQVNENPCFKEYQYCSRILDPYDPTENEEYFILIAELDENDNPKDEKNWVKANPIVTTYEEGLNFIRGELRAALDAPEKMRNFLTKNMNVWVTARKEGFLPLSRWDKCKKKYTLEDLRGCTAVAGIDLSSKIDLTSIGLVILKDGELYTYSHSFIPSEQLEIKMKTDKVDYQQWVDDGYITVIDGALVDYEFVEAHLDNLKKEYDLQIREVGVDSWNATQVLTNLANKGYTAIEVVQGFKTLAPATKDFRDRVYGKTIYHNNNPVLTWAIGNAITRMDSAEHFILDKKASTERIDPIASLINAHTRTEAMIYEEIVINQHILSEDWSL